MSKAKSVPVVSGRSNPPAAPAIPSRPSEPTLSGTLNPPAPPVEALLSPDRLPAGGVMPAILLPSEKEKTPAEVAGIGIIVPRKAKAGFISYVCMWDVASLSFRDQSYQVVNGVIELPEAESWYLGYIADGLLVPLEG